MKKHSFLHRSGSTLLALVIATLAPDLGGWKTAWANASDIASAPIFTTATATTEVKPNVMFVLDDSGSMAWTFMPDTGSGSYVIFAVGKYGYASSQCNGVYYNPAIIYNPPLDASGASYPISSFSAAQYDGYNTAAGALSTSSGKGTVDLGSQFKADMYIPYSSNSSTPLGLQDTAQTAYYYVYSGAQTTEKLRNFYDNTTTFYKECNSSIGSTPGSGVFSKRRLSTTETTTITVSGTSSTSVSSITVNGVQLMSNPPSTASTSSTNVAANIAAKITLNGFSATAANGIITITGPTSAANFTPAITQSGSMVLTPDVFPDTTAANLTNFANWYSYYRTRMQLMKTSAGQAFKTLGNHFRVGFMTIDNNASPAFLNISDFDSTQKSNWYTKLYSSVANNGTPLRETLANVGRMYAGQVSSLNGVTVTDPLQYACQQNYTILSTDGFWNGTDNNVHKLDGSTTMDNEDGDLPRWFNDGATSTTTVVTPYTSTQDRQTVTSGVITTNTWTKYTTVIGSSCTTTGGTAPPANTTGAPMSVDNSNHTAALGISNSNPDSTNSHCYQLGSNNNAWFCRGSSNGSPAVSSSSVTDKNGKTWYLVSSGAGSSGCVSSNTAFGNGYSSTNGVCPGTTTAGVTGKLVTTTPYTQTETISGSTATAVMRYTATQTTTQTITNGVPGTVGALTPTTPVYTYTTDVSSSSTPTTTDLFGNWTAGTPNPNNVCTATASLPTAGTTTPAITSTSSTSGTTSAYTVVASSGPTAGTPTSTTVSTGGTSNTLADVASYYYRTNLRTSALNNCTGPIIPPATTATDLCLPNKVPANGNDTATWQHMTTFTLGLGARGKMVYSSTYLTDTSGDFYDVWKGTLTANTTNCTWRDTLTTGSGPCNWPVPAHDTPQAIDDLWHAAVDGHGSYFSATDPTTLANSLSGTLNVIINTPQPGTASAAATTNPVITSVNNFQFRSYFLSVEWSGEVIRQTIDTVTGSVPNFDITNPDPATYDWSARTLLDARTYSTRTIYTKGTSGLIPFTWADLGTAGLQSNFTTPNITTSPPSYPTQLTGIYQFCATGTDCISSTAQTNNTIATGGAAGEALVNFLRGDRSNEEGTVTDSTKFFRHRTHVLGDVVSTQSQYVGPPNNSYADANYAAFVTANASRSAVVYTAANDGMLHAFDAATGAENWAYIPSFLLPRLYTLADKKYSDKHQYFVEGTPTVGDICPNAPASTCSSSQWKTILVGGLNQGGTGFYALDITNPATPVLLWEYTNANMGFSFGNPQITKLDDGTWVVLVTSGYNNCQHLATTAQQNCVKNAIGDGKGYLYVLNAATGNPHTGSPISTGVGGVSAPSGLARIIAQGGLTNTTTRVYGGDLLGNLWRFTIGSQGYSAQLLATFVDAAGNTQPITDKPQVTSYLGKPLVYVGTGRYLGTTDVGNTLQQTFYGIKDNLGTTSYGSPRADPSFISRTAVDGSCPNGTDIEICQPGTKVRTVTLNGTAQATDSMKNMNGWYVDFPANSGELEFTDPKLVHGTLAFSTSVPSAVTSSVCGSTNSSDPVAFFYMLDYLNGGAVGTTSGVIATSLGTGLATMPQIMQLPGGTVIAETQMTSGKAIDNKLRFNNVNLTKRISWRELIQE